MTTITTGNTKLLKSVLRLFYFNSSVTQTNLPLFLPAFSLQEHSWWFVSVVDVGCWGYYVICSQGQGNQAGLPALTLKERTTSAEQNLTTPQPSVLQSEIMHCRKCYLLISFPFSTVQFCWVFPAGSQVCIPFKFQKDRIYLVII